MLDLEKYLNLVDQVRKLPEVGDPIIRQAELIQADAKRVAAMYLNLEAEFDELCSEIKELWTKEERHGSLFQD